MQFKWPNVGHWRPLWGHRGMSQHCRLFVCFLATQGAEGVAYPNRAGGGFGLGASRDKAGMRGCVTISKSTGCSDSRGRRVKREVFR